MAILPTRRAPATSELGIQLIVGKPGLPGNNEHTLLCDTSRGVLSGLSATASASAPGASSPMFSGTVLAWVKPTGQTVTVVCEVLTDPDGATSAAWETDVNAPSSGSFTVAAGATQPIEWTIRGGFRHFRIRIVAGATGPTDLDGEATLIPREV